MHIWVPFLWTRRILGCWGWGPSGTLLKEQGSYNLVQYWGHRGPVLRPRCIEPGGTRTPFIFLFYPAHIRLEFYYYYWYSALGPVWAETRVQSDNWYGSGTLHSGQVLRSSLPLLSPEYYVQNLKCVGVYQWNIFYNILCVYESCDVVKQMKCTQYVYSLGRCRRAQQVIYICYWVKKSVQMRLWCGSYNRV